MEIKQLAHGETGFWNLMGPFFASAQVHRELGIAPTSDQNTTWWLALDAGEVVGFAAVKVRKGIGTLSHAWVAPAHRGEGIHRALLEARLAGLPALGVQTARSITNEHSLPAYIAAGFTPTRITGRYTHVERTTS